MESAFFLIGLLAWLQVKHFIADYLLQPGWILKAKGDFFRVGGYAHAAIHVAGTVPGLLLFGTDGLIIIALAFGEFVSHFLIDHLKAVYGRSHPVDVMARSYWAAHGFDQLMHHLSYAAILLVTVAYS